MFGVLRKNHNIPVCRYRIQSINKCVSMWMITISYERASALSCDADANLCVCLHLYPFHFPHNREQTISHIPYLSCHTIVPQMNFRIEDKHMRACVRVLCVFVMWNFFFVFGLFFWPCCYGLSHIICAAENYLFDVVVVVVGAVCPCECVEHA